MRTQRAVQIHEWSNECLYAITEAKHFCLLQEADFANSGDYNIRQNDLLHRLSALIEQGRLFFRNVHQGKHGQMKFPARRGFRPEILDPLIAAYQAVQTKDATFLHEWLARFVSLRMGEDQDMHTFPIAGSYRPTLMGTHRMVASGHPLASLAGERVLARGGNAIDAGVAAGLCLTVLQVDMIDLAGVAPIMIYLAAEDRVITLSGLGRWPQAASVAYFQKHCGGRIPSGVLRCVTPGAPDAWITALEQYGTMRLGEVMQDAIQLAEQGFPMHPFMAANLQAAADELRQWPSSAAIFLPDGRVPEVGERFVQS